MESSHESWMAAALQWLAAPRHRSLPAHLPEAIAAASGVEIEQLLEILASNLDALPLQSGSLADGSLAEENDELEEDEEGRSRTSHDMPPAAAGQTIGRLRAVLQMAAARALRLRLESESAGQLEPAIDPDVVADLAAALSDINALAAAH
ncbi:MAG: hypothetical protein ACTHK7_00205, partial [Aureliella sp.]